MQQGPIDQSSLLNLPPEISFIIFEYLTPTELIRTMLSCTALSGIAKDNSLWSQIGHHLNLKMDKSKEKERNQEDWYQAVIDNLNIITYPIDKAEFAKIPYIPLPEGFSFTTNSELSANDYTQKALRSNTEAALTPGYPVLFLREQILNEKLEIRSNPKYQIYHYEECYNTWQLRVTISQYHNISKIENVNCPLEYLTKMLNEKSCGRKYLEQRHYTYQGTSLFFSTSVPLIRIKDKLRVTLSDKPYDLKEPSNRKDPVILRNRYIERKPVSRIIFRFPAPKSYHDF